MSTFLYRVKNSTAFWYLGYHQEDNSMFFCFNPEFQWIQSPTPFTCYHYPGIDESMLGEFIQAKSKGGWFHRRWFLDREFYIGDLRAFTFETHSVFCPNNTSYPGYNSDIYLRYNDAEGQQLSTFENFAFSWKHGDGVYRYQSIVSACVEVSQYYPGAWVCPSGWNSGPLMNPEAIGKYFVYKYGVNESNVGRWRTTYYSLSGVYANLYITGSCKPGSFSVEDVYIRGPFDMAI